LILIIKTTFECFSYFQDYAHRLLIDQLKRIPDEQIQIYSNDLYGLPPKLRLPTAAGKPLPIIIFAKEKFYFSYNTEQNAATCYGNNNTCPKSSKIQFIILSLTNFYPSL
jgi:hypothetical protein